MEIAALFCVGSILGFLPMIFMASSRACKERDRSELDHCDKLQREIEPLQWQYRALEKRFREQERKARK